MSERDITLRDANDPLRPPPPPPAPPAACDLDLKDFISDDENVKAMRETAQAVGLTDLLVSIARSPYYMAGTDIEALCEALELLGVEDWE